MTTTTVKSRNRAAAVTDPAVGDSARLLAVKWTLEGDADRMRGQIAATQGEIAGPMSPHGAEGADDSMAFASHTTVLDQQLNTLDNTAALLAQTERALQRIVDGTYRRCEACNQPVGQARQQASPRAVTCLRCQTRRDRLLG